MFHPDRNFLSSNLVPIFIMFRMAIIGKTGSDPSAVSFVLFPSRLPTARAVPVRFILAPVGRRIGKIVVEGEHLTSDTLAL
jgi:hypothetical protein